MMTPLKQLQRAFNRGANTYDANSALQQAVAQELIQQLLNCGKHYDHGIDLGCGTGLVTEMLLQKIKCKKFMAIDIAESSLAIARERLRAYPVHIDQHDFQRFQYSVLFDLMFSNMALHWSSHLTKTLHFLCERLAYQGLLVFSIPLAGTFAELICVAKNHFCTYDEIVTRLVSCGFQIMLSDQKNYCYRYPSKMYALRAIKAMGANFVMPEKRQTTPFRTMKQWLTEGNNNVSRTDNSFHLTYEIGCFMVKKV